MSEALLTSLNDRVARLERENADLRSEAKKYRQAKSRLSTDHEGLRRQVDELTKDRDGWKAKAEAAPSDQAKRITELEGQIRNRDHRDAFAASLNGQLADKVTVEDVWSKITYTPGESLPGPDQLKQLVSKARDAAPYLFRSPGDQSSGQQAQQQPAAPPWAGRGHGQSESPAIFTDAQLRDPAFMLSDQAKKLLANAS